MLASFFPKDRIALYRACPHRERIDLVGHRLVEQRYLTVVIAQHLREWLRFATYLEERELDLPVDSRAPEVQTYITRRRRSFHSASRARFVRASLRILLEADESGRFRVRVGRAMQAVPSWLSGAADQYVSFLRDHLGLASRTVYKRSWQLARFAEHLESVGARSLDAVAPSHVQGFQVGLHRTQAIATRKSYAITLRSFLGWAYAAGLTPVDLRPAVVVSRRFKQGQVRDVLSEGDVQRIFAAVDRSTAIGRRDYVVLLLAARYGLRPCDIRALQLEALRWREGIITFRQAKTDRVLTLPLFPDVAAALVAYLRSGRPATTFRHVFVRHRAPFEPFVPTDNFSSIMRKALQGAGLGKRSGRRGLYLFRHTLANRMLSAKCSIKSIADVLGHATTETTMEYIAIDLAALRCVMVSESEVHA